MTEDVKYKDYLDVYKKLLKLLREKAKSSDYSSCFEIANHMTEICVFDFEWKEGVFISEFFEYLYSNLRELAAEYEIEKDVAENISKIVTEIIDEIMKTLPKINIEKIYPLMVDARYIVTRSQWISWKLKRKKRRLWEEEM